MKNRCHSLIFEIETYFKKGIILNGDSCHFIRSTFSEPSLSELKAIISDPSNPDKDSVLELIFTPDEALQTRVEGLLSTDVFLEEDEKDLAVYLAEKEPAATVFYSGFKNPILIKMPGSYAHKLVSHLRIKKRINRRIIDAVERYVSKNIQPQVKVRLRNSNFNESRNKVDFLCMFFKSAVEEDPLFSVSLDFILLFLEEMSSDSSIGHELFKRRQHYIEKIRQASMYEEQLKKSNMETMMMQGRRNQCINIIDLQEKMDIINYLQNITRAVHEWANKP